MQLNIMQCTLLSSNDGVNSIPALFGWGEEENTEWGRARSCMVNPPSGRREP